MAEEKLIERLREAQATLENPHRDVVALAIERLESMSEQLAVFKRSMASRFRPTSEKVDPGQLTLELLNFMAQHGEPEPARTDEAPEPDDDKPRSGKPARTKRRSGVELLPVEHKTIAVEGRERVYACGREMASMGHDVRRQIVYTPARLYMLEEHLEKCACSVCKEGVTCAEGSPKPIEGGLASSSLLAHIAVRKCLDAVPVERTGRILAREGAELSSSTLHDWFATVGRQAGMLASCAHEQLLRSQLISLDDTTLLSKAHDERDGTQRGRLWMYVGDVDRIAVCRFSPDWKGTHPQRVLEGFEGTVQLDGYGGLNPMFKTHDELKRVGCNDHCRRHFVQALSDGDKRAALAVDIYRRLYEVEALAKAEKLTAHERVALRQQRSKALWHQLTEAIESLEGQVTRKSPLGKGVRYWRKQRPFLAAFLDDGFVPISNIHVEQLMRIVALFRKNSLFVGNTEAGERYADLMTLMVNCILCGANPYAYLRDILHRIASGWPARRRDELLPRAWLADQQQTQQPAAA